jgi:glycosyltransferase involved in cell wall biosynthesis
MLDHSTEVSSVGRKPWLPGDPPRPRIAYLSSYPPRLCGIATFCEDLLTSTWECEAAGEPIVVAMTSASEPERYGWPVRFLVDQDDERGYEAAAEFLNSSPADMVSIQHEFGIFGGPASRGLRRFLARIDRPVVTTLHTVLPEPLPEQRETIRVLGDRSDRVVVMNGIAADILRDVYGLDRSLAEIIHHGAPPPSDGPREEAKRRLGLGGRRVMSTFGLVGPGKGLEYAVAAVPAIRRHHRDVCYLIIGKTHPGVQRSEKESYREKLVRMAHELGVEDAVRFVNSYQTKEEIIRSLAATDVYVTPYLNPDQICSGTLAYAVAAGKAVVSTRYLYAQFLLADGRGKLVDFRSPAEIADAAVEIFDRPELQRELEGRARRYGRQLYWPMVSRRFLSLCHLVAGGRLAVLESSAAEQHLVKVDEEGGDRRARRAATAHIPGTFAATK